MLKELKGSASTYRINDRRRRRRSANLVIGILIVFIAVAVVGGLIYIWYIGKTAPVQEAAKITTTTTSPITTDPVVDEDAPVGVAIQTITSPVTRGKNASVAIRTRPEAACSIRVYYSDDKTKESEDGGLIPKTADEYGVAEWTWTVESSRPAGKWPVYITCAYNTHWGVARATLEVTQ